MLNLRRLTVASMFVMFSCCASAQATRTWVSGVGDDANPCSRTAPCKTFAGAISKTAAGGEIDALDPGGFGALTITKAITVDGGGTLASVLSSGTNGININAGVSDIVTLRNLSINGAGTGLKGVNILQAGTVHLENVVISNMTNGVVVAASGAVTVTLDHVIARDTSTAALTVTGASGSAVSQVSVRDSSFLNSGTGLIAGAYTKVLVTNSTAAGNTGVGYQVSANGLLTLVDSSATANGGAGFSADSTSGNPVLTLVRSTASSNTGPGLQGSGAGSVVVRMTGSALLSNGGGISATGTVLVGTYGDNEITNGISGTSLTTLSKQ